jgi:hypothetical protein
MGECTSVMQNETPSDIIKCKDRNPQAQSVIKFSVSAFVPILLQMNQNSISSVLECR